MATQTPNIGLTKQAQNEYNHNPVLNSNWDIVDSKMGQVPAGKSVQEEIGDLSNLTTTDKSSLVGAANELNSKLVTQTGSVTAETGFTSFCIVKKTGNVVIANISFAFSSLTANAETKLGTVASGFRPSATVGGIGVNANSEVKIFIPVYFSINTNGEIKVMANSTSQTGYVIANISYTI